MVSLCCSFKKIIMFSFQEHYYVWITWIIVNFFANVGRVNTISICKIAVKSLKLRLKTSFWYIPEIIARIFNKQGVVVVVVGGGGGSKISLRKRGRGHIANVTESYKGGGSAKFSPKTVLRKVWIIPNSSYNSISLMIFGLIYLSYR